MTLLTILELLNYALVLFFGIFLSVHVSGGCDGVRRRAVFTILCVAFFLLQGGCYLLWGVETAEKLYPMVIHLPLTLALVLLLKKSWGVALVSVCTAYLCCQIPRWVSLVVLALTESAPVGEVFYTLSIVPAFYLLRRYFAPAAHSAMTCSRQTLVIFGSLPLVYYCFDYATTVYSDVLYREAKALYEFLPTVLIVFYVLFLALYHVQLQRKAQVELQSTMLETELEQAHGEMERLKSAARQTAVYQHDMRHHLQLIDGFLAAGKQAEAEDYIRTICSDIEAIMPRRYCENGAVNLLCSSFAEKAERNDVMLTVETAVGAELPLSDTELCSVLSNGLENALHAVKDLEQAQRWVRLYCAEKSGNLLVEVCNPYNGRIKLMEGLPLSDRTGHGYGCRSIVSIVRQHRGHCIFEPKGGVFTLRIAIPLMKK